jgi:hypothetical protein
MVLRAEEVPKTLLGRQGRLGWTTWLHPRHQTSPAADLFLDASADSLARRFDEKDTTLNSAGEFA